MRKLVAFFLFWAAATLNTSLCHVKRKNVSITFVFVYILLFVFIGTRWWFSRTALKRDLLVYLVVVLAACTAHRCAHLNSFGKLNERKENFLLLPFCVFFHFSHSLDFPPKHTTSLLIWLSLNMSVQSFSSSISAQRAIRKIQIYISSWTTKDFSAILNCVNDSRVFPSRIFNP